MEKHMDDMSFINFLTGKLPKDIEDSALSHLLSCKRCRENLALFLQISNLSLDHIEEHLLSEIFPESAEEYSQQILQLIKSNVSRQEASFFQKLYNQAKAGITDLLLGSASILKQKRIAIPSAIALVVLLLLMLNPIGAYLDYKAMKYIQSGNELLVDSVSLSYTLPLRPQGSFPWQEFQITRGGSPNNSDTQGSVLKDYFEKALELRDESPEVLNAAGNYYLVVGNFKRARELFQKTLDVDPSNAIAANGMGVLFFKEGKIDLAIKNFTTSVESNPNFIEARYNLAFLYQANGNYKKAKQECSGYLQMDASSGWAENIRDMLKNLP